MRNHLIKGAASPYGVDLPPSGGRARLEPVPLLGIALMSAATMLASPPAQAEEPTPLVSVSLEPTRAQLEAGGNIGVVGKITNVSDKTVYLRENDLAITLPVELEGRRRDAYGYYAMFPTDYHDPNPEVKYHEYYTNRLALHPGDSYRVVWTPVYEATLALPFLRTLWEQRHFIFFAPGDYVISFSGKYWLDPTLPEDDYRTITQGSTVTVAAPEVVIIFGASLGGLIGFVVFPGARVREVRKKLSGPSAPRGTIRILELSHLASIEILGAVGAMLMAAIVTILLSRLASSQFIIQVTIRDFWGAIAIGFVAHYAGASLLGRLAGEGGGAAEGGTRASSGDVISGGTPVERVAVKGSEHESAPASARPD